MKSFVQIVLVAAIIFEISSAHVTYQQQPHAISGYSRLSGQQQTMTPVTLHPVPSSASWWPAPRHHHEVTATPWRFIPLFSPPHGPLTVVHHHVIHSLPLHKTHQHKVLHPAPNNKSHHVNVSTPRNKLEPPPTPTPKNNSREDFPDRRVTDSPAPASTSSSSSEIESGWREDEDSSEEISFPRPFRGY